MAPVLRMGDRVRLTAAEPDELHAGDIAAFVGEDGVLRTHRVVRQVSVDGDLRLMARGDNERGSDPPVPVWAVVGRVDARERFGVVSRTDSLAWRLYEPSGRVVAAFKVVLRRVKRRRDRRRPGRVKDHLGSLLMEGARLHPSMDRTLWHGLDGMDSAHLSWLLKRHRLAVRIGDHVGEDTPAWALEVVEREAAGWRAACVTSMVGLDAVMEALSEAVGGVRARPGEPIPPPSEEPVPEMIVLKGPVYGELLYGGACRRPFGDLDIVVRPDRVEACREALCAKGWVYRPRRRFKWQRRKEEHNFVPGRPPATLKVELHTGLVDKPEFVPELARRPDLLWEEAIPGGVGGHRCLVLSPEAMLVHTAIHWHLHNYSGLLWGLDVALAAAGRAGPIDWEKVVGLGRRWRVTQISWLALTLASLEHDAPVPPKVLHALHPWDPLVRWLVRRLAGRDPVFRRERRLSLEQAMVLTMRDNPLRRLGAALLLPARVLAWEREGGLPTAGEGSG